MFDKKVHVTRVDIYETSGAGSEKAIKCNVGGHWTTLWSTTPVSSSPHGQIFSPNLVSKKQPITERACLIDVWTN
ncbi:hypothetical protein DPMN_140308 [Dreissena polymorpha]|uniref:Uncharacterized protein n=1 Tax=Dreissena polymorpha TaxID=45954 RepID=A0A9D4G7F0_DREPO|nr:hypothetical protein DPMN_140308 [Dreissena polymorpha]